MGEWVGFGAGVERLDNDDLQRRWSTLKSQTPPTHRFMEFPEPKAGSCLQSLLVGSAYLFSRVSAPSDDCHTADLKDYQTSSQFRVL